MHLYLDSSAATVEKDESSEDDEDSVGIARRRTGTVVDITPGKSETQKPSSQPNTLSAHKLNGIVNSLSCTYRLTPK